jgi:superfamily II DNA or RNA helicase
MHFSHAALSAGQQVVVRDERWTVVSTSPFDASALVTLRGLDSANRDALQTFLTTVDRIEPVAARTAVAQRSRRVVLSSALAAIAAARSWHQCWTADTAAVDPYPWQLEPAAAAVAGTTRILLADGVGLGKTIEAALIISELSARALVDRVLILTPASIREQWAAELTSRFAMRPVIFDQAALGAAVTALPPDVNPWMTARLLISSIDLVKRPEVRAALDATPFDLLIIDEAHHLTPRSDRAAVAADLAERVPWVVLATATPHPGDDAAYAFLTSLGGNSSGAMRVFRRAVALGRGSRRSRTLMVRPTNEERALFAAVEGYARTLARLGKPGARLVAAVVARRAAASAAALARTISRRIALLRDEPATEPSPLLPWEEVDVVDDAVGDALLRRPGLEDLKRELVWLRELMALADAARPASSKLRAVRRLLRRARQPAIIFSEYRDVALEFAAALADVTKVAALHGGLAPRERRNAIEAFVSGGVDTLVATDAAGEGLNLHARCRLVINVELPWMPRRLEQRIGRVDRLGQRHTVHAVHLAYRDSYEGTVIARLERRRARARSLDGAALPRNQRTAPCHRADAGRANSGDVGAVYSARRRHATSITLIFTVALVDGHGRLVQNEAVAVRLPHGARVLTRQIVRMLATDSLVHQTVHTEAQRRAVAARQAMHAVRHSLEVQLSALAWQLSRRAGPRAWQASLFDRREEQRAHHRATQYAALREHLSRQQASLRDLDEVGIGQMRLIAAWLS